MLATAIEKEDDIQMRPSPVKNSDKTEESDETSKDDTNTTNANQDKENKPATNLSLNEVTLSKDDNVIIVLGSESSGISTNFKDVTTHNIYIPPLLNKDMASKSPFNIIDSLNVGVSAGIIINHLKSELKKQENHTINNLH